MKGYAITINGTSATMEGHSTSAFTAIIRSTSIKSIIEAEVEVVVVEEKKGEVEVVGQ